MSEESDRMMVLLQELAVLERGDGNGGERHISEKRRKEISQEMKRLASRAKKAEQWMSTEATPERCFYDLAALRTTESTAPALQWSPYRDKMFRVLKET
jgi:hypothetical protein